MFFLLFPRHGFLILCVFLNFEGHVSNRSEAINICLARRTKQAKHHSWTCGIRNCGAAKITIRNGGLQRTLALKTASKIVASNWER